MAYEVSNKAIVLVSLTQTATGAAIAAWIMDGTQTLLPYFAGSFLIGIILTLGSAKWRSDLTYLALAVVFGTVTGLSASRLPSVAWASEWLAICATPFGPLFLTSIRENPAAALEMVTHGVASVRNALWGKIERSDNLNKFHNVVESVEPDDDQ